MLGRGQLLNSIAPLRGSPMFGIIDVVDLFYASRGGNAARMKWYIG